MERSIRKLDSDIHQTEVDKKKLELIAKMHKRPELVVCNDELERRIVDLENQVQATYARIVTIKEEIAEDTDEKLRERKRRLASKVDEAQSRYRLLEQELEALSSANETSESNGASELSGRQLLQR